MYYVFKFHSLYIAQKNRTQRASSKRASATALPLLPAFAVPVEVAQRVEGEFLDHGDDAVLCVVLFVYGE